MTKKKVLIIGITVVVVIAITVVVILRNLKQPEKTLSPMLGYTVEEEAELPEVTKTFLQQVSCEVLTSDENAWTATVSVKAPDLTGVLQNVIERTIEENPDLEYEEQLSLAKHAFAEVISGGDLPTRESELYNKLS